MKIEVTNTYTKEPKLTIAKGRVALKFNHQFPDEDRAPYIRYAELIAEKVGEPKRTLRGKFAVDSEGNKWITLKDTRKARRVRVSLSETEITLLSDEERKMAKVGSNQQGEGENDNDETV
jgi:hypothetical protein